MRISLSTLAAVASLALVGVGCAGPEQKFGRGLSNVTAVAQLTDLTRSIEQTSLWDGAGPGRTTGMIRGLNRTIARTAIGTFELVTFPIPTPTYDAFLTPKGPLYPDNSIRTYTFPFGGLALPESSVGPDSYRTGLTSEAIFDTSTALGFTGGDKFPLVPGSRFRIFEE